LALEIGRVEAPHVAVKGHVGPVGSPQPNGEPRQLAVAQERFAVTESTPFSGEETDLKKTPHCRASETSHTHYQWFVRK